MTITKKSAKTVLVIGVILVAFAYFTLFVLPFCLSFESRIAIADMFSQIPFFGWFLLFCAVGGKCIMLAGAWWLGNYCR